MSNVKEFTIDPDITLETGDMPLDIKGHLLGTMTLYCKKRNIHWTEVDWAVTMQDGQPIINLKEKT